jgi:NTP pyrophosphatase (non-canonical NTP hydrolase)
MASFNDEYVFSALKTESMSEAVALRLQDERTIRLLYGKAIDYTNLAEEIGDQLWYVAIGTDAIEVRLDDVMDTNIAKLKARYPQNFDAKAAVNRDLEAERKILESVKISVDTMERRG